MTPRKPRIIARTTRGRIALAESPSKHRARPARRIALAGTCLLIFAMSLVGTATASVFVDRSRTDQIIFEFSPSTAAKDVCMHPEEFVSPDSPWRPASPGCSLSFTIDQDGSALLERGAYWSSYDLYSEPTKFVYSLGCGATGKLRWRLSISAEDGSGWSEELAHGFWVPRCVPLHRVYMLSGRARSATLKALRGEYVTSLRCPGWSRRWGTTRCVAVYERSYRVCVGVFRTREYEWIELGEPHSERSARLNKRKCYYF